MRTHDEAVHDQFDPQARAYLASVVHASGPDLEHARELVTREVSPAGAALDVGCGAGHLSFALAPVLERVVALDPSCGMLGIVAEAALHRGLRRIETREGGAESLPFEDATFDVVATRFSAHHWRFLEAGLTEMYRVLKARGHLLVIDCLGHEDPLVERQPPRFSSKLLWTDEHASVLSAVRPGLGGLRLIYAMLIMILFFGVFLGMIEMAFAMMARPAATPPAAAPARK